MNTQDLKFILPIGMHITERPLANGKKSRFFRVQMNRKGIKVDQIFEDLELALSFLNEHRRKIGLEPVALKHIPSDELFQQSFMKEMKNPTFSKYVDAYLDEYIRPKFKEFEDIVAHYEYLVAIEKKLYSKGEISRREMYARCKNIEAKFQNLAEAKQKIRQKKNTEGFYKCICEKEVPFGTLGGMGISIKLTSEFFTKRFGDFIIKEIKPKTINSYVKVRVSEGIKASSIQREITFISNIYSKLHKLNEDYDSPPPNPALSYDKELLASAKKSKEPRFRFTEEKKKVFFTEVEKHENPEFRAIVKLLLFTAMRRSEVILLKWNQVQLDDGCIDLPDAKGKSRTVYLIPEAIELLQSLPRRDGNQRVFPSYSSVMGFEGSFTKFVKEKTFRDEQGNVVDCSDITCHKLRKEAILKFVELIGAENSLLISEFLGLSAIRKLEQNIKEMPKKGLLSQQDVLQSVGHINSNVTKKHYFSFLRNK